MAKKTEKIMSKEELKKQFIEILHNDFQTIPDEATDKQVYEALSKIVVGIRPREDTSQWLHSLRARRRCTIFQWSS